jgi:hypothetical protein
MPVHSRIAALTSVALVQLWMAGCGEIDNNPPGTGTGGTSSVGGATTGGSAGSAVAAGRGGNGTAGSGAAAAGGSAGTSASGGKAAGGSSDAGSGGASGASGGGAPDCYPPCLWDLFENCRPTTSCIEDASADSSSFIRCEAATGWRVEATFDLNESHPDPDLLVTVNGQTCLTASYVEPTWTYKDPTGTVVATVTTESQGVTGRCPLLETPGQAPVTYPVDDTDPRCAGIECTPGTCP